jgi:glycosyltransferase involved in cell wall biosynthesis
MSLDLALVMPVCNEEGCIAEVLNSWLGILGGLGIRFKMIVLNDGSKDGTKGVLAGFAHDDRIEVVNKSNSGHGPTILMGYHRAVETADWVFQCDSDNEMSAGHFPALWGKREGCDAVFGIRTGRVQNAARRLISAVSRLTVRAFFGRGIADVNTPYRLMRAGLLNEIIAQIPDDTFAPNVIISGTLARARARILTHPVPHQGRRSGKASIVKWKLWKSAVRAFCQTACCRPTVRVEDEAR